LRLYISQKKNENPPLNQRKKIDTPYKGLDNVSTATPNSALPPDATSAGSSKTSAGGGFFKMWS
jgi:hypothetical protein